MTEESKNPKTNNNNINTIKINPSSSPEHSKTINNYNSESPVHHYIHSHRQHQKNTKSLLLSNYYYPKTHRTVLPKLKINPTESLVSFVKTKKEQNGSLFITDSKRIRCPNHRKNKKIFTIKKPEEIHEDVKEINDYNVFNNEDNFIKDLMKKFYNKALRQKPPLERRKLALNKLYDITPEITERVTEAKHRKYLSLENYQSNILDAVNNRETLSRGKLFDLVQEFNDLRAESDSVKPLPKINVDIIEEHVRIKGNSESKNKKKKISLKELLKLKSNEPKDEFEKEERLINSIKNFKLIPKKKRNRNLDNMPYYIRELFSKKNK